MEIIRRRRQELELTALGVAEQIGIPKTTLLNIERGRCLPEPEVAQKLRQILSLPGLPDSSQVLRPTFTLRHPFARPRPNQIYWQRAENVFAYKLRRLKVPLATSDWMKENLDSESPVECLALWSLAAVGAVGQFSNPHAWGYRDQCILDRDGKPLGERCLPGLQWKVEGKTLLIWPQVNLLTPKGTFRVDLLVMVDGIWYLVEIDGKTHVLQYDNYREECLARQPIRIKNEDVCKLRFVPLLRSGLGIQRRAA